MLVSWRPLAVADGRVFWPFADGRLLLATVGRLPIVGRLLDPVVGLVETPCGRLEADEPVRPDMLPAVAPPPFRGLAEFC